jgi:hypothetical protein
VGEFRLPDELREGILEDGYGPEVPAALEQLVQQTRVTAVRLTFEPVGEPQRRRTLGEFFTGKRAPRPPEALPRDVSKVGGVPWLDSTDSWPRSERGPLEFIAQLCFRDLPRLPELPEHGILSLFKGVSPDVFGLLWFPEPKGVGADPPPDAPPSSAKRESRIVGSAFDMFDVPDDLGKNAGLKPEDNEIEHYVFEAVLEANGDTDGGDHVLLGHHKEHRRQQNQARAVLAERSGPIRPMDHALPWADTAKVPAEDCARFRLLLTLSFDHGFAPVGDNDIRLLIRDDDLAAGRLDRAAPMIHSVG